MQKQDWEGFFKLMKHAANLTAMPNGKNLEDVAASYFVELEPYSLAEVTAAVRAYCHRPGIRFFPALGDITGQIEPSVEDTAAIAWADVLRAMGRWGYYDSVRFPDPAIHFAIAQMGGWMHLCATLTNDELPFRQKDFAGYYALGKRMLAAHCKAEPYLHGKHEAENRRHGYAHPRLVWDTATGRPVPESELPALTAPQTGQLVQIVAGAMEVTA